MRLGQPWNEVYDHVHVYILRKLSCKYFKILALVWVRPHLCCLALGVCGVVICVEYSSLTLPSFILFVCL